MTRVLVAASGTGGHIFPALAVAEALPASWDVCWLGVSDRLEIKLVPEKFPLESVKAKGLQGSGIRKIFQVLQLLNATRRVCNVMRKRRVQIVFTTGGYIAAPAILGAFLCRVPVILHESNAIPGRVSRLLGGLCDLVAVGLPVAKKRLPRATTFLTGTPLRKSFLSLQPAPDWIPPGDGPLIVILGGSQGAVGLNHMVRGVIPSLVKNGCRVIHLTGSNDNENGKFTHDNFIEKSFSHEMPGLLQHADLAISRAGAGTLAELALCRTPAILVPYPSATDQHQEFNAAFAAEFGGAVIVHQHHSDHTILRDVLARLLKTRLSKNELGGVDPLIEMRNGMEKISVKDSHLKVVKLLESFS